MQPAEPGVPPRQRLRGRIVGIDRRLVHLAPAQPHAGAVLQVDGGIKRQLSGGDHCGGLVSTLPQRLQ